MKLLVDPSVYRHGRCGLTRYYAAVCEGLQQEGVEVIVPLLSSNCDFSPGIARYTRWARRIPKATGLLNHLSRRWFHRLVRSGNYDCILLTDPGFDPSFLAHNPGRPFVMVVHDMMSCITTPDGLYDLPGPGLMRLLYLAVRATRIICISEDTRSALLAHATIQPAQVATVRTGNLLALSTSAAAHLNLPPRYILFVGERSGRKGFYALIRAFADVLRKVSNVHLVCTGTLTEAEQDYISRHTSLSDVHAISADDSALVTLYRRAACLVYVSLYEGFGLPVVEAMHYGCPVITTTCGALQEIAGSAARIVPPEDHTQLVQAILELLQDHELAERLRAAGRLHARSFQVETMMKEMAEEITRAI